MKQVLSNFDSRPLTCDPALFPGKNSLNIGKSNRIFPGKGRGDKAFILTYLDSPTVEVFLPCFLTSAIFRGKQGVKVRPKMPSFGSFLFNKNSNPSKKTSNFFFARVLPLVRISAILDFIWGSKDPNTSQKEHWMLNRYAKLLKILNLTTANAILMKLTTIMYLHESVNREALIVRNSVFWINFQEFLDYIKNRHMSFTTLSYITGKAFVQVRSNLGECFMKNHPKYVQNDCYTTF